MEEGGLVNTNLNSTLRDLYLISIAKYVCIVCGRGWVGEGWAEN